MLKTYKSRNSTWEPLGMSALIYKALTLGGGQTAQMHLDLSLSKLCRLRLPPPDHLLRKICMDILVADITTIVCRKDSDLLWRPTQEGRDEG